MIRQLRITDVPRQLLPGRLDGIDLACTHASLGSTPGALRQADLARWSFRGRHGRHTLVLASGPRLDVVAVLKRRRGPRAWEIEHLFASHRGLEDMATVLDRCTRHALSQGAERLFLRTPLDSPVHPALKRSGFTSAFIEEVLRLPRAMASALPNPAIELRPVQPADAYELFRLYNATVPGSARAAIGLTLDQWSDGRESPSGKEREYVWDHAGAIGGWIAIEQHGDAVAINAIVHPDAAGDTLAAISGAARLAWAHREAVWTVPAHLPQLARALTDHGWQTLQTYDVLVRALAATAPEPSLMPAQA